MKPIRLKMGEVYVVVKINEKLKDPHASQLQVGDEISIMRVHSGWLDVYAKDTGDGRFDRKRTDRGFRWVCLISDEQMCKFFSLASEFDKESFIVLADPVNAQALIAGVPAEDIYC